MTAVYGIPSVNVGLRVRDSQGKPLPRTSPLGYTAADGSFMVSGSVELVKISSAATGAFNTYLLAQINASSINDSGQVPLTGAVRSVGCSVTSATANQTIPLAAVSPSVLNSAGATAATTPFSIGLNCEAGVKVAVTFSSASGNSGIPSVIASNGTAKGVGVQLLNSSRTPISLDTALQLSSGTTGNMSFQFYGQYYRLGGPTVTAGTVNASAIFTMSYQ
ncbi:hypothetical protein LMG24238_01443 [Paraburkholderia sediminicola]|uniref:Fimbrial-type adhesion domain-containing protein n=1 Tax=Paraburkholderia sediminicola TaxID=458836 RepID=A0A6J5A9L3_9BURK|nr:fimbrial protein [Paraburkholderia sediminicola]CAB3656626.1 hypothetical protein LMG24238_01443 [Paraburkholderia sediminicola]